MKPMDLTILQANSNTVLTLFHNRCGLNLAHSATVIHHIIPRSVCEGDPHRLDNLIPLCRKCHNKVHQEGTRAWKEILVTKREHSE